MKLINFLKEKSLIIAASNVVFIILFWILFSLIQIFKLPTDFTTIVCYTFCITMFLIIVFEIYLFIVSGLKKDIIGELFIGFLTLIILVLTFLFIRQ